MTPVAGTSPGGSFVFSRIIQAGSASTIRAGTSVLEQCSHNFRRFLRSLRGDLCPVCVVARSIEALRVSDLAENHRSDVRMLCGHHLQAVLNSLDSRDPRTRADVIQAVLAANLSVGGLPGCRLCTTTQAEVDLLIATIRKCDGRFRFEKALERGPLFCRLHAAQVCAGQVLPGFSRVHGAKLKNLSNDLLRARARNDGALEKQIEKAVRYVEGDGTLRDAFHSTFGNKRGSGRVRRPASPALGFFATHQSPQPESDARKSHEQID